MPLLLKWFHPSPCVLKLSNNTLHSVALPSVTCARLLLSVLLNPLKRKKSKENRPNPPSRRSKMKIITKNNICKLYFHNFTLFRAVMIGYSYHRYYFFKLLPFTWYNKLPRSFVLYLFFYTCSAFLFCSMICSVIEIFILTPRFFIVKKLSQMHYMYNASPDKANTPPPPYKRTGDQGGKDGRDFLVVLGWAIIKQGKNWTATRFCPKNGRATKKWWTRNIARPFIRGRGCN